MLVVYFAMIATARADNTNDARLTGIRLLESGRFAEAIPYFDRVLASHGRDIEILNKRGICFLRTDQPEKALADFDRVVENGSRFARSFGWGPIYDPNQTWLPTPTGIPSYPPAYGNRGIALLMLGRDQEAADSFTRAANLWNAPEWHQLIDTKQNRAMIARGRAGAYEGLGQAHHRLGQNEQAVSDYTQAIQIDPTDANGFAGRGDALTSLKLAEQAIADFTEAIRLDPDHSRAYLGRGIALIDLGRDSTALADLDRAIAIDPRLARAYSFRGALHSRHGRNELALADYDALISLLPDNPGAFKDRGGVLVRMGRFDAAIKDLTKAIRLDPKRAKSYLNRGAAYNGLRQYERAISDLTEAIRLDSENAGAFTNRGLACFGAGLYDQSITDLSEAIQIEPANPVFHFNRAEVFARLGVRDRAIADYQEALRLNPAFSSAKTALAQLESGKVAPGVSTPESDMALHVDSTEVTMLLERGNDRRDKGDWLGALADYNKAIVLDPRRADLYVARGWSRLAAGADGADFDAQAYLKIKGWGDKLAPHMAVLAVLGARSAGRMSEGQAILDEAFLSLRSREWPLPILRYLAGQISQDTLLAVADTDRRRTDARLCVGLSLLSGSDRAGGQRHLEWVRAHAPAGSIASDVARATIERIAPTAR
jgi:tetratricopeptide (TPR) repeat protein